MDYRTILTRSALSSSISSMNLLSQVPPEVRQTHDLLSGEFNPLELCKKLDPLFKQLEQLSSPMSGASPVKDIKLSQYVSSLKQVCGACNCKYWQAAK